MATEPEPRWYHCTTHTYGAWLPGDPRGFRTRHHVEHVEGDYKNPPPPGLYDERFARSKALLKQEPVIFPADVRPAVGRWMVEKLTHCGAHVLCLSVGGKHVHLLAKMPPGPVPRTWVGHAKRHAAFMLKDPPFDWTGKVWAVSSGIHPVRDRDHQLNTFHYILRHATQAAWVWDFRKPEAP